MTLSVRITDADEEKALARFTLPFEEEDEAQAFLEKLEGLFEEHLPDAYIVSGRVIADEPDDEDVDEDESAAGFEDLE